jgi:hypothetical protein
VSTLELAALNEPQSAAVLVTRQLAGNCDMINENINEPQWRVFTAVLGTQFIFDVLYNTVNH